jgi:threonine/homoserine/homoserine lactone efflux protein
MSPGAAFFGIIQTSLSKGFRSGVFFALGIALGDIFFIALCLWGFAAMLDNSIARMVFGLVCGCVLVGYGLITFFNQHEKVSDKQRMQVEDRIHKLDDNIDKLSTITTRHKVFSILKPMSKGFLFNLINPAALVTWMGIMPLTANYKIEESVLFFACVMCSIFCVDLLKSFFAVKIKRLLTPRVFYIVNRVIGIIFVLLGIFMIVKMVFL